jgi:hypothetical protein
LLLPSAFPSAEAPHSFLPATQDFNCRKPQKHAENAFSREFLQQFRKIL